MPLPPSRRRRDYVQAHIAALTREATGISGIQYIMDLDKTKVEELLNG